MYTTAYVPVVSVMVAIAAAACLFTDQLVERREGQTTPTSSGRWSLTPAPVPGTISSQHDVHLEITASKASTGGKIIHLFNLSLRFLPFSLSLF